MPIGERIGQAYVKVILDGADADLARQLGGKAAAKKVDKEFKEQMEGTGRSTANNIAKEMSKTFRGIRLIDDATTDLWWERVEQRLKRNIKDTDIADVMLRNFKKKFTTSGGDFGGIEDILFSPGRFRQALDTAAAEVERFRKASSNAALADIAKQSQLELRAQNQRIRDRDAELRSLAGLVREAQKFSELIEKSGKNFITTKAEVVDLTAESKRLEQGFRQAFGAGLIPEGEFDRLRKDFDQFNKDLRTTNLTLNRTQIITRDLADGIGRTFGRGSRNNFLNFVGSLARNITNTLSSITIGVIRFGSTFTRLFSDARAAGQGFFSSIASGLSQGGGLAALATRFLPALAAGFVALIAVIGPLISLVVSLGGALAALALTIGGALVGGLGLLAGALLPLVAGFAGLTAAILLMDDATKKSLKTAIQPFVAQAKVLGKIFADSAFKRLPQDIEQVTRAFKNPVFEEFAERVGTGLDVMRTKFVDAFSSKNFRDFFKEMGPRFQTQLSDLADIMIRFGSGFGGVFISMQEPLNRFLGRLRAIGQEFATFANSAGGRAALADFFSQAEASLASVGRLIREVGKNFALLFRTGGADAGIGLIDSLTKKFQQFNDFIKKNPATVRAFFADAEKVLKAVGTALLGVIKLFDALDTAASRKFLVAFFTTLGGILSTVANIIDFVTQKFTVFGQKVSIFGTLLDTISNVIPAVGNARAGFAALGQVYGDTAKTVNGTTLAPIFDDSALTIATESIGFTEEEMQALHKEFGIPLIPKVDVSPLETARDKISQVVQSAFEMNRAFSALPGGFGAIKTAADILKNMQALTTGQNVSVLVKPTLDPTAVGSIKTQISGAVSTAPAPVKPTLAPGALAPIRTSLASLQNTQIIINAGGNAQAVIGRTKAALDGLVGSRAAINISAGGNAQAVIGRTKAALAALIGAPKALNITAGGNAQGVIARTQTALNTLMRTPSHIDISAGGNAQGVISRTKTALDSLPTKKTITINVVKTGSGASLVKRGAIIDSMASGGVIRSMASGGFANFRQFIRPDVIAGESGREAVVPLSRPLSQVDPSVRMLSAIAQGKIVGGSGAVKQIDMSGWTVVSNSKDPAVVAVQVANEIAGSVT